MDLPPDPPYLNYLEHRRRVLQYDKCHAPLPLPDLHLDPLDINPPGVGGLVQRGLHVVGDLLPLREDLGQTLGTQHIPTWKTT